MQTLIRGLARPVQVNSGLVFHQNSTSVRYLVRAQIQTTQSTPMATATTESRLPDLMNSPANTQSSSTAAGPLKPGLYPAEVETQQTVCVTGATGYLGSNLVYRLLAAGHTVHGTVRNVEKAEELKMLPGADRYLKLFKADLFNVEELKVAMQDCSVVFHTASPFSTKAGYGEKARKALVEPAVKGTENVLSAVDGTSSVCRVVLTSSTSSIVHSWRDQLKGAYVTEDDWNTKSSLNDLPYNYSKTQAEKVAWEIAGKQSRWELVVINPSVIFGPPVINRMDAESITMVQDVLRGDYAFACPIIGQGNVDVRDVAAAHCLAAFTPGAHGRNIVSAASRLKSDLVVIVSDLYPNQVAKPKHVLPRWLAILQASFKGGKDVAKANVGGTANFNNEKSIRELGLTYIPLEESVKDMCEKLEEMGGIHPKK